MRFEGARLQGWVSVTNTRGVVVLQDEAIEQPARCFLQEAREDEAPPAAAAVPHLGEEALLHAAVPAAAPDAAAADMVVKILHCDNCKIAYEVCLPERDQGGGGGGGDGGGADAAPPAAGTAHEAAPEAPGALAGATPPPTGGPRKG